MAYDPFREAGKGVQHIGGIIAGGSKRSGISREAGNLDEATLDLGGTGRARTAKDVQDRQDETAGNIRELMGQMPGYKGVLGKDGTLDDKYKINAKQNLKGMEGQLNKIKEIGQSGQFKKADKAADQLNARAFGTGTSKWAQARMNMADQQHSKSMDEMTKGAARDQASALGNMAALGGAGGGSRERLAAGSMRNKAFGGQSLAANLGATKAGITADDEAQRMQLQAGMPGVYSGLSAQENARGMANANINTSKADLWGGMANADANRDFSGQQYNSGAAIGDIATGNAYDLEGWKTKMAGEGAIATGNAQAYIPPKRGILPGIG